MGHHHGATNRAHIAEAEKRCDAAGENLTPLRRKVLELLMDQQGPAKAYDLLPLLDTDKGQAKPPTIYRALDFLASHPSVDPDRIGVIGFSQGAYLALLSVERGGIERDATKRFRAAVGFYPPCLDFKGDMTAPTLIMVGELDDWAPAVECRNLAEGRDDFGISREKGKGAPILTPVKE